MCHVSQKGTRRQRGYSPRPTFDMETSRRSPSRFETIRRARPPSPGPWLVTHAVSRGGREPSDDAPSAPRAELQHAGSLPPTTRAAKSSQENAKSPRYPCMSCQGALSPTQNVTL